jgi:glycosyltransferase involved in cell wall biosynthesis
MLITVAICTYNRCGALVEALRSLRAAAPPVAPWELIVVDNGSQDATASALAQFCDSLPLRVVVEPEVGLSRARNAAVAQARGDYIIWIDDDVLVDPNWLRAYENAFHAWPDSVFFGGPITPLFDGTPPQWLIDALKGVANAYAALDYGAEEIALDERTVPYGANFAIRTEEQRSCLYDPRLGRRGTHLYGFEESAVLRQLLARGARGRWVPGAHVRHVISRRRQTPHYLRSYYEGHGTSIALTWPPTGAPTLLGRPRWLWREAISHELAYRLRRLYASSAVWTAHLRRASVAWGMLRVGTSVASDRDVTSRDTPVIADQSEPSITAKRTRSGASSSGPHPRASTNRDMDEGQ